MAGIAAALVASLTFKEIIRSRVFGFVVLFALLSAGSIHFFQGFTLHEQEKFVKDIGLATISFFTTLLAIVLGVCHLQNDFEDRSIYTVLSNPVGLWAYLLGKFTGIVLVLTVTLSFMAIIFYLNLVVHAAHAVMASNSLDLTLSSVGRSALSRGIADNVALLTVFAVILLQSFVAGAVSLWLAVFLSTQVAMIWSIVIFMAARILDFVAQVGFNFHEALGYAIKVLFVWIPNYENFNLADAAVLGDVVSWPHLGWLTAYAAVSIAVFLALSYPFLQKRVSEL